MSMKPFYDDVITQSTTVFHLVLLQFCFNSPTIQSDDYSEVQTGHTSTNISLQATLREIHSRAICPHFRLLHV